MNCFSEKESKHSSKEKKKKKKKNKEVREWMYFQMAILSSEVASVYCIQHSRHTFEKEKNRIFCEIILPFFLGGGEEQQEEA